MNSLFSLILNVSISSTLISIAIKYGGPMLSIPATQVAASIAVWLPMVIVTLALCWRSWQQKSKI